jgi:hypothetical protein
MPGEHTHAYPPSEWTHDDLVAAFEDEPRTFPVPTYGEADVWAAIREDPLTMPVVEKILDDAETIREEGYRHPTASEFLSVHRTGQPGNYDNNAPVVNLGTLTLAECFEREGRYLDAILDHAWGICDMATWFGAYHLNNDRNEWLNNEGLPREVDPEDNPIDLSVARFTHHLAETDHILGDRLHPALRERIRETVDRRAFTPYLANDDHWWLTPETNNWNAVCNGGVLNAALYLEDDTDRLASIVKKGVDSLRHYLSSFDRDGCTSEGIGYWNFGVRKYTELAAALETRTNGEHSLFSVPVLEEMARYPLRIELSPRRYVAFADSGEDANFCPYVLCRIGEEFGLDQLSARGRQLLAEEQPTGNLLQTVRDLAWCRDAPAEEPRWDRPETTFFRGWQWWVSRVDGTDPDSPVVAAKGGHNHEAHNHNDCGSFMFHYRGESLLTDPGGPSYFQGYFGDERYEHIRARSLGHSVPYVNGCEQGSTKYVSESRYEDETGPFAAEVLDRVETPASDTFAVELAGSYPADAGLASLRREFELDREAERLTLEDRATFADDASDQEFVSVLVSEFPMEPEDGRLVVTGEAGRAVVDPPAGTDIEVEFLETDRADLHRARLTPPVESGDGTDADVVSRLVITPEPR